MFTNTPKPRHAPMRCYDCGWLMLRKCENYRCPTNANKPEKLDGSKGKTNEGFVFGDSKKKTSADKSNFLCRAQEDPGQHTKKEASVADRDNEKSTAKKDSCVLM